MNEKDRRSIALRVTKARTSRGWSKESLAERANITTTTLRRIEDGLRVQDAKLEQVLQALGIEAHETHQDALFEEQIHPGVFLLPPEIERGYENVVRFTRAVADNVPALAGRATRLMVDAAGLFSDAADDILAREGGDGHDDPADSAGRAAAIAAQDQEDVAVAAHDELHTIESEQEEPDVP